MVGFGGGLKGAVWGNWRLKGWERDGRVWGTGRGSGQTGGFRRTKPIWRIKCFLLYLHKEL